MRVIHVAGTSGSGKTTFIRALVPLLQNEGMTAVVKHLGHHMFSLDAGKDTTLFFGEGVAATAGVDPEKTVLLLHDTALDTVLSLLAAAGIRYAVVEGWKYQPFPKIEIGDLSGAEEVVLSNPTPAQVFASLAMFPQYCTLPALVGELRGGGEQEIIISGVYPATPRGISPESRREFYLRFSPILKEISGKAGSGHGGVEARLHLQKGLFFGGEDEILMAVKAESSDNAMRVFASLEDSVLSALDPGTSVER